MGLSMMFVGWLISKKNGWGGEGKFSWKAVWASFIDSFFALLMPVISYNFV